LIYPPLDHWIWLIPAFLIGACIGSFLNVVIYRLPLGLSVNDPRRSFCPLCKEPIPLWLNLPLVSWLWLRGKCAACGGGISFRYVVVELLTALLFAVTWWFFPPQVVIFLWVMLALWVAIAFIDAEHLIIPTGLTWAGSLVGLGACAVWPRLPAMAGEPGNWLTGLLHGGLGWLTGFVGLWLVVELGKLAFGKKPMHFENPVAWHLKEPVGDEDPMCFVIDGEEIAWWDMFTRKSDRLVVESPEIFVDAEPVGGGKLVIREMQIVLPDGTVRHLAQMKSLAGTATSAVIPREAMGIGDVHLMGMIGAFFGWSGVVFSLFSASFIAIIAALIGRIGFGKQLPFGPFLVMGAVTWLFGGWKLLAWYMDFLQPLWMP
jgi:leader peptidase (prepilin peptidase)/N-methyltransferase